MDFSSLFSRHSPKSTTKSTTVKMDRRFSQLFILPQSSSASLSAAPEYLPTSQQERENSPTRRQNLKLFFRRLLPSTNDSSSKSRPSSILLPLSKEELGEHLWADLVSTSTTTPGLAVPPPPTKPKKSHMHSLSTSHYQQTTPQTKRGSITLRKHRPQSTVIVYPPNTPLPSFKRDLIFSSAKSKTSTGTSTPTSRPDSKFSSISSLPSLASLTLAQPTTTTNPSSSSGTITLPSSSLRKLQSSIRRIRRGLQRQEYLTSHLSNNLVFLFGKKERQIGLMKRLRLDEKQLLINAVFRIKESAGRSFLRKAVFLSRSSSLATQISDLLSDSQAKEKLKEEGKIDVEVEVEERIIDLLSLLNEDLKTQRGLDEGLRTVVIGSCGEARWLGSENERIMMRRFGVFVEGRLQRFEECYGRVGGVVDCVRETVCA